MPHPLMPPARWRHLLPCCLFAGVLAMLSIGAGAEESSAFYIEAGQTFRHGSDTRAATVGLRWPMQSSFWDGQITGAWDAYASQWNSHTSADQDRSYIQIGLVPMFRYRFDGGQSPWFVEAGVGVSYLDKTYYTPSGHFSTQWNFSDHLGVGRNFGLQQRHSVGLYLKHVSNGALRQPNPGESFLQLRYSFGF